VFVGGFVAPRGEAAVLKERGAEQGSYPDGKESRYEKALPEKMDNKAVGKKELSLPG